MNKVYFTAPLAALLVFASIYAWSQSGQKQRAEARQAAIIVEREAKLAAEKEARRTALEENIRLQAERKKERAEREAREAAEREQRDLARDARDQAFRDQERLTRDIERLKREVATELEAVDRLQSDYDAALAEQAFLEDFVPQARANATNLQRVLEQIAAAEAARAKQAAEAAQKRS
jgi:hypothetical protein